MLVLDNRSLVPPGTLLLEDDNKNYVIAMWGSYNDGTRFLPGSIHKSKLPKWMHRIAICRDFMTAPAVRKAPITYKYHPSREQADKNHADNLESVKACRKKYEPCDTVILCGGGPSIQKSVESVEYYRSELNIPVVTVSRVQPFIQGDYYVHIEPNDHDNVEDAVTENTIAHLLSICSPLIVSKKWKELTWGAWGFMYSEDNIPLYLPHENVTCIALEFVIKVLKAKKIVMVGMDHTISTIYFWHGIELQSMAWHAARHGLEIWNCTPETTVFTGMFTGGLEDAFAG